MKRKKPRRSGTDLTKRHKPTLSRGVGSILRTISKPKRKHAMAKHSKDYDSVAEDEAPAATAATTPAPKVELTPSEELIAVLENAYAHSGPVTPWMIERAREVAGAAAP